MFLNRIDLDDAVRRWRDIILTSLPWDRLGGYVALRKHDLTIELHDLDEDGDLILYSPSVVPALPGSGDDEALHVSDSVGSWEIADEAEKTCSFSAVRLLADDDGGSIGKVFFQGSVQVIANGAGMEGTFTFDQSSGTGKTVNSGAGTVVGTHTGE